MATQQTVPEISFPDYHAAAALTASLDTEVARAQALVPRRDTSANNLMYFNLYTLTPGATWVVSTEGVRAREVARTKAGLVADTLPTDVSAHWDHLRLSGLPGQVFNDIVSAAVSPKRVSGRFAPLSAKSLGAFLHLWSRIKTFAAEPVVSVTPTGCVVAEWVKDGANYFAILVTADEELVYSLFEGGIPLESSVPKRQVADLVATMQARAQNPFLWSDAF